MIGATLRTLVVEDEGPAREELAYLLDSDDRVAMVRTASGAAQALKAIGSEPFDVVFCDVKMPGLDGVELARVLTRFSDPPQIVFVTAYDDRAVEAFELPAVDYLLKPVRGDRLAEAVRRVVAASYPRSPSQDAGQPGNRRPDEETIAVELGGVTRFVRRSQVLWVEAQGDYARLHTATASHLIRVPLATLEQRWAGAGFVRIHRSTLVAIAHIDEVHHRDGHSLVRLAGHELPVSRRHNRALREVLVHGAQLEAGPDAEAGPDVEAGPDRADNAEL